MAAAKRRWRASARLVAAGALAVLCCTRAPRGFVLGGASAARRWSPGSSNALHLPRVARGSRTSINEIGDKVEAEVVDLSDILAFVRLGGPGGSRQGTIHISEVQDERTELEEMQELLPPGKKVDAYIKKFNRGNIVALTLRDYLCERKKLSAVAVGEEYVGEVAVISKFGTFVDIGAVVSGLIPLKSFSGWAKSEQMVNMKGALSLGDEVKVVIQEVDVERGHLTVGLAHPV